MQKRWLVSLCLCIAIWMTGQNVLAVGLDDSDLLNSQDYEKVAALEQELLSMEEGEIAYDKAIKVYTGVDVFDNLTIDEIYAAMQQSGYEWKVPIYNGDKTSMISFYKTPELSEESVREIKRGMKDGSLPKDELEKRQEKVGKFAFGIGWIDHHADYIQMTEDALRENGISLDESEIYFFNSQPGVHYFLMALVIYDGEKYVISLDKDIDVQNTATGEISVIETGTMFAYDILTFKKSTATSTPWLIGVLTAAAVIGGVCILRKMTGKRRGRIHHAQRKV
ncbi:MAG TPA: hypothetical protein IAB34_12475 [Candidatus Egerieimonas faecigallinarum]|nr:hypothetical protein [Candidatus Egerieimonas faecigallinarum]